jgi:hypothetical protein
LMCVTPAGKIGNCTWGMSNCCQFQPKRTSFFTPPASAKLSHFLSSPNLCFPTADQEL